MTNKRKWKKFKKSQKVYSYDDGYMRKMYRKSILYKYLDWVIKW